MNRVSIGIYAFVTSNWKELDYPLDLWLQWHRTQFDEISLITYGKIELPDYDKTIVKVEELNDFPTEKTFDFYVIGKMRAQKNLTTDWKILLDIDEFMFRPDLKSANKIYAYPLKYHNLYGSLEYEIKRKPYFANKQYRIHCDERIVTGDGANVSSPYKNSIAPNVWHLGAARNPVALRRKWIAQIRREFNEGYYVNTSRFEDIYKNGFDYEKYKDYIPDALLKKSNLHAMPSILLENADRFSWWKP